MKKNNYIINATQLNNVDWIRDYKRTNSQEDKNII